MPVEHLSQIGPRIEATRRAARYEPSIVLQRRDRSGPRRGAGVLDNNVNAFARCQSLHFLRPLVTRVVDRLISPELARLRKLLVCARRRDYARAAQLRD